MKLHFLNPKIFFLTSITITYNPSLRLSSPLNNFNILPIYNSHFKTNYNRNKSPSNISHKLYLPLSHL